MTKLKEEPKGFPTILYITDKGETSEEYDEPDSNTFRKVDSFVKWIDSKIKKQQGGKRKSRKTKKSKKSRKSMKSTRKVKKTRRHKK